MQDKIGQQGFGFLDEIKPDKLSLTDKFIVPPFSVLDTRQGYWQDRKAQWLALGIESELGRGEIAYAFRTDAVANKGRGAFTDQVFKRQEADKHSNITGAPKKPEWATGTGTENMAPGTSIFDPVLCELMYRWFCPDNGSILDPFAGGSVRGIVAHSLGRHYTGIDLSKPQVEANKEQASKIVPGNEPTWIEEDARNIDRLKFDYFDFIFTCPPYFNLEIYTDLPSDLSNAVSYPTFIRDYTDIIGKSINTLSFNRFACFVVANIRDKKGYYHDLVGDTIRAFKEYNVPFYNEIILVNVVGSMPIRINHQFDSGRKVGKVHQNVLVFYYGDPDKISEVFAP